MLHGISSLVSFYDKNTLDVKRGRVEFVTFVLFSLCLSVVVLYLFFFYLLSLTAHPIMHLTKSMCSNCVREDERRRVEIK